MPDVSAHEQIRTLVASYALGCDLRDASLMTSLFVPGAEVVIHAAGAEDLTLRAPDDIERIPALLTKYDLTYHNIGTHRIVFDDSGDSAHGDTYCTAHHLNGASDRVMVIHYVDRYTRDDSGWRFDRRDLHLRFTEYRTAVAPMPPANAG